MEQDETLSQPDVDLLQQRVTPLPSRIVAHIRRDVPLAALDMAVAVVAYLVPLVLRFEGSVPSEYWGSFWSVIPLIVGLHLAFNFVFRLYGRMWRYASIGEAQRVIAATLAAGFLIVTGNEIVGGNEALGLGEQLRPLPLSVAVFGVFLALLGFGAIRFQSRLFAFRRREEGLEPKRVLIVGAGDAGEMILKDIVRNAALGLQPVGLVDDDRRKRGRRLHGLRVLGARGEIPDLVAKLGVEQVILAIPSARGDVVRDVVAACEQA
ncbi:MAG: nucleoside-diphosphate sugar epimerase/dehydratase, partial [Actinomycetota bacterium]